MAEAKKTLDDGEEYVTFTAPFADMANPRDLFIAVNGDNVVIRPGETVQIKRKFVRAYENSRRQELAARRYQRAAMKGINKPMAEL